VSSSRRLLFALTVVVALLASGLGGWQLQRLFARQARNRIAKADVLAEATDLNRATLTGSVSYRQATASGTYDHQRQIFLRGRLFRGTPGVQVVTPLRLEGQDTALLVNRGFVPTADAGHPTAELPFEEPGLVTVEGIALSIPDDGDGQPLPTPAGETWRRLDWGPLQDRFPYPIRPYYLIVTVDTGTTRDHTLRGTTLPVRIEPPPLDDGPHLSYAVQWFMIAGAALGFGLVFVRRQPAPPSDLDLVS
jgi:surfeit locus 1 family protein